MVEIKWQDPPASDRGKSRELSPIIAALKNNPGKWALVREEVSSSSASVPWRKQGCQSVVRRKNLGETPARYDVYARWPEKATGAEKVTPAVPAPKAATAAPAKGAAAKAIATGTALTPPPPPLPKQGTPAPKPANHMGLQSFLEARRARGAAR